MKKSGLIWGLAGLLLLITLCGCAGDAQKEAEPPGSGENLMACYAYGDNSGVRVFNSQGKLIVKVDPPDTGDQLDIASGSNGDLGVVRRHQVLSEDRFADWGGPLTDNTIYTFYDTEGNTVKQVDLQTPGDFSCSVAGDSLADCRFFTYNDIDNEPTTSYKIFDENGAPLLEKEFVIEQEGYVISYAYMRYNGKLMFVNYDCHAEDWSNYSSECDIYAPDGTPLTLAQDYCYMNPIWMQDAQKASSYLEASYRPTADVTMIDILNPDGSVLISGLNQVYDYSDNMIFCRIGNEKVLLDMQGNRLYVESVYTDLDD